jgi:hypothetical protein
VVHAFFGVLCHGLEQLLCWIGVLITSLVDTGSENMAVVYEQMDIDGRSEQRGVHTKHISYR